MEQIVVNGVFIGKVEETWGGLVSAIDKLPVEQEFWLGHDGLPGDEQADIRHHGGLERALHHYPAEHYRYWRKRHPLNRWQLPAFGEHLDLRHHRSRGLHRRPVPLGRCPAGSQPAAFALLSPGPALESSRAARRIAERRPLRLVLSGPAQRHGDSRGPAEAGPAALPRTDRRPPVAVVFRRSPGASRVAPDDGLRRAIPALAQDSGETPVQRRGGRLGPRLHGPSDYREHAS